MKPNENDPCSGDTLSEFLSAKIRAHIFSTLPLRVIKWPEMELKERNTVAEYIIQNNLGHFTEKICRAMGNIIDGLSMTDHIDAFISMYVEDVSKFATLSHTWGQDEPNYEDFVQKHCDAGSQGYKKLKEFCRIAHEEHEVEFTWADTVCIDKRSSSELDESIRSMFTWYHNSFISIVYLADTETLLEFPFDTWFTRGWTLQELLASRRIKFHNKSWQPLTNLRDDKSRPSQHYYVRMDYRGYAWQRGLDEEHHLSELLGQGISEATGILIDHIYDFHPGLHEPSLPERMKWIARRNTTRPEDMSYSMMGVLGVSISIAYGEGAERAFFRLFQAVLEKDWSPDWFLWGGKAIPDHIHPSRMIPSSPASYLSWDYKCFSEGPSKKRPIALTNSGLQMKVLVVPAKVIYSGPCNPFYVVCTIEITCPLSDDTIVVPVLAVGSSFTNYTFALGILDCDFWPTDPGPVYPIFLRRREAQSNVGNIGQREEQEVFDDWERCETEERIFFRLKDEFLAMAKKDRFRVGYDMNWRTLLMTTIPQIEFRSLYL